MWGGFQTLRHTAHNKHIVLFCEKKKFFLRLAEINTVPCHVNSQHNSFTIRKSEYPTKISYDIISCRVQSFSQGPPSGPGRHGAVAPPNLAPGPADGLPVSHGVQNKYRVSTTFSALPICLVPTHNIPLRGFIEASHVSTPACPVRSARSRSSSSS